MSVAVAKSQAQHAELDWTADWGPELAANTAPTIDDATVTTDTAGANITNQTVGDTFVTYRLECSTVPVGTVVGVTVHVILSNGEEDEATKFIRVT